MLRWFVPRPVIFWVVCNSRCLEFCALKDFGQLWTALDNFGGPVQVSSLCNETGCPWHDYRIPWNLILKFLNLILPQNSCKWCKCYIRGYRLQSRAEHADENHFNTFKHLQGDVCTRRSQESKMRRMKNSHKSLSESTVLLPHFPHFRRILEDTWRHYRSLYLYIYNIYINTD